MEFKVNLNRIHYLLSEKFSDIKIEEKASQNLGSYVQITVKENLECKIIIKKKILENTDISFLYLSNPLNEQSYAIERSCNIDGIVDTVVDILENKRFDSDYLNNLS